MKEPSKVKSPFRIVLVNTQSNTIEGSATLLITQHIGESAFVRQKLLVKPNQLIEYPAESAPGSVYSLKVSSDNYRTVAQFVTKHSSGAGTITLCLPLNPDKVKKAVFKGYEQLSPDLREVLERTANGIANIGSGEEYYAGLNDKEKAGLFNIYTKMKATLLDNRTNTFDYVDSLITVKPARFYAKIRPELAIRVDDMSQNNNMFDKVNGLLHETPQNYRRTGSYKTRDLYGNLQLTISIHEEDEDFVVDADIDNSSGLSHIFDVIEHEITQSDSNPYDIREILLRTQNLDPGYDLIV